MQTKSKLQCDTLVYPSDSIFQSGSHMFFSKQITENILANFNTQKHDIMEFLNIIVFDLSSLNVPVVEKKIQAIKEIAFEQKTDQIVSSALDDEEHQTSSYQFLKTEAMDPFFSQIIFECFDYVLLHRRNFLKELNQL